MREASPTGSTLMTTYTKTILVRFLRGFGAGFTGAVVPLLPLTVDNANDLQAWLTKIALAGIAGGVSGILLALDKALRWESNE